MGTWVKLSETWDENGNRSASYGPPPRRVAPPPPAPPPEPPRPEFADWQLQPAAGAIAARVACNGGDVGRAVSDLLSGVREQYRPMPKYFPSHAAQARKLFADGEASRLAALGVVASCAAARNGIAELSVDLAGTRRELRDTEAELAQSKATLNSPDALKLDGPTLALLTTKTKHLPTRIAELKARVKDLTARRAALASDTGVDVTAVIGWMIAEAVRDSDVWKLIQQGFLKAD